VRKNSFHTQNNCTLIIYDPLVPREKSTHHSELSDFILQMAEGKFSQLIISKPYLEWKTSSRVVNRIVAVIYLIAHAVILSYKIMLGSTKNEITIINPNENPISLMTLLLVRKIVRGNWKIFSRFICTRDSVLTDSNSRIAILFYKILRKYSNTSDKYAAETFEYSNFLSVAFQSPVSHIPYPPIDSPYEINSKVRILKNFTILGAAREDKGFLKLPELFSNIESKFNGAKFYVQRAEVPWTGYQETFDLLQSKKNIEFLPSYLSNAEMLALLCKTDVILLPYDLETFRYRGSAFARRGMYLGKRIVTTDGTTMSKDAIRCGFSSSLTDLFKSNDLSNLEPKVNQLRSNAIKAWEDFLI